MTRNSRSDTQALKEQTDSLLIHERDRACYFLSLDGIQLPPKWSFGIEHDYYTTAKHVTRY